MNKPSKHFKLVAWRLVYGVAVQKPLNRNHEIDACLPALLALDRWDAQKAEFPREWAKLLAKRQRYCSLHNNNPKKQTTRARARA